MNVSSISLNPITELKTNHSEHDVKIEIPTTEINEDLKMFEILKTADRVNLSFGRYITLRKNLQYMPEKYRPNGVNKLKVMKKRVDDNIPFEIKRSSFGFYCSPLDKIKLVCEEYIKKGNTVIDNTFIIKICCDGTVITKANVHLLNFTFTVINDEKKCKTASGHYILGLYFDF